MQPIASARSTSAGSNCHVNTATRCTSGSFTSRSISSNAVAHVPEGVEQRDVDAPVDGLALDRGVDDVDPVVEALEHVGEAGHDELEVVGERDANRARSVHRVDVRTQIAPLAIPLGVRRKISRSGTVLLVELEAVRLRVPFGALDLATVDEFLAVGAATGSAPVPAPASSSTSARWSS